MNNIWILAQASDNETSPGFVETETYTGEGEAMSKVPYDANVPGGQTPRKKGIEPQFLLFMGLMFVVMYFLLFRGPRKKQQKHKKMVQSLKKNDKVRTIGGILGTVVDVKDNEITLKIDEANNTKIKISHSAIGTNLSQDKDA